MMKSTYGVGVLLIVLGLVALIYQGFTYTTRETVLDIGPIRATADRERSVNVPPVAGVAAVAAGVALIVVSKRKA